MNDPSWTAQVLSTLALPAVTVILATLFRRPLAAALLHRSVEVWLPWFGVSPGGPIVTRASLSEGNGP